MKVAFYNTSPAWGMVYNTLLSEIHENINKGNTVILVNCDGKHIRKICKLNIWGVTSVCYYCKIINKLCMRDILPLVEVHSLSEFYDSKQAAYDKCISYKSLGEIKKIEYNGVNIGLGCVSSYVSLTRNINPCINRRFRKYMGSLLIESMNVSNLFINMIKQINCDKYILLNGRFAENRVLYEILKNKKYQFESVEVIQYNGLYFKEKFENSIPQEISLFKKRVIEAWNCDLPLEKKKNLAVDFFERKRRGESVGDVSYVRHQVLDSLPNDYDSSKINIVIFNSSEDEYFSISEESCCRLYSSQLEAYNDIISKFSDNDRIHFYLRVHPNLRNVHYRYHRDLYLLSNRYPNVTVVSADSDISSYHLLDVADKVIVYASSMGMEAAYAGKPIILLSENWLYGDDIAYVPHTRNELYNLIRNELVCKSRSESLKYGFYYQYRCLSGTLMGNDYQSQKIKLGLIKYTNYRNRKLFGSNKLFVVVDIMLRIILVLCPNNVMKHLKVIPRHETGLNQPSA